MLLHLILQLLYVVAPPAFEQGIETLNTTIIRIPFYSAQSITEKQYNMTDSKGDLRYDHTLMTLVDSNVTLVFHGYHRSILGQAFVWNISGSGISIPTNFSLSIWNDFGTSVYEFYWQPYSSENVGEFQLAIRRRQNIYSYENKTKTKNNT